MYIYNTLIIIEIYISMYLVICYKLALILIYKPFWGYFESGFYCIVLTVLELMYTRLSQLIIYLPLPLEHWY